jgi:hypothetical protein
MLEMSRKEPYSCSFAAGWAPWNYGLERFPTRNIKHEASSLSTCACSGLLIILIKGFHSPTLLTRGYRCIVATWRAGKQMFLQPAFARSDRKFNNTREVNRSSTVASDRSSRRSRSRIGRTKDKTVTRSNIRYR